MNESQKPNQAQNQARIQAKIKASQAESLAETQAQPSRAEAPRPVRSEPRHVPVAANAAAAGALGALQGAIGKGRSGYQAMMSGKNV